MSRVKADQKKSEDYKEWEDTLPGILTENVHDIIYKIRLKPTFHFEYISPSAEQVIGYTPQEHYDDPMLAFKIVHPDDKSILENFDPTAVDYDKNPIAIRWIHKKGHIVWTEQVNTAIYDENDECIAIEGIARDITDRKQIENILRIQMVLSKTLSQISDLDEALNYCLQAAIESSGMDSGGIYLVNEKEGSLILKHAKGLSQDFIDSTSKYSHEALQTQLVMKGKPIFTDYMNLGVPIDSTRKQERLIALAVIPILHENNVIGCMNISTHSQTEIPQSSREILEMIAAQIAGAISRLKIQEALLKSEEEYRALVENLNTGIYRTLVDDEGYFIKSNIAIARIFGFESTEELNKYPAISFYRDRKDRDDLINELKLKGHVKNKQLPLKKIDGTEIYCSCSATAHYSKNGEIEWIDGVMEDITDRKKKAEELLESERFLSNIFSSIQDGISVLDCDYNIIRVNQTMERWYAHNMPIVGMKCYEAYHGKDKPCKICPTRQVVETSRAAMEMVLKRGTDSVITGWLELYSFPIFDDETGELKGVIEYVRDITDHRNAEESLRRSEEMFRAIFETARDSIYIKDKSLKYVRVNPAMEKLFGIPAAKMIGKTDEEIFGEKDGKSEREIDLNVLKGKIHNMEVSKTVDGKARVFNTIKVPLKDPAENIVGLCGISRDITDRKKMEEEIQKIEKLESIGILAGGIAHDFNNILAAVVANLSLIKTNLKIEDDIYNKINEAEKNIKRATSLTNQLLTFSRGGAPVKEVTYIGEIIEDMARFALSGTNINIEMNCPADLFPVEVDIGQINQVINNLIINSVQAMPRGGTIKIKVENVQATSQTALLKKEGKYVKITIRDNGTGISKETLKKIFDPYFTTKKMGSGLGLAVVYSIIIKHNGYIEVESELNRGTVFIIHLPAITKKIPDKKKVFITTVKGSGRILIMEDDEYLLRTTTDILTLLGYSVTKASEGKTLIGIYFKAKQENRPFKAILTDLTIKGAMGGKEAIQEILTKDPEIKAIALSGYSNDPVMAEPQKYGFKAAVKKPFTMEEISIVLHKVINQKL